MSFPLAIPGIEWRPCEHCGADFDPAISARGFKLSVPNSAQRKYCSPACTRLAGYALNDVRQAQRPLTGIVVEPAYVDANGYPRLKVDGWVVPEHVYVMEQMEGRRLINGENVHHKNTVHADNRPENLELWVTGQPNGARAADIVTYAREIIDRSPSLDAWAQEMIDRYGS